MKDSYVITMGSAKEKRKLQNDIFRGSALTLGTGAHKVELVEGEVGTISFDDRGKFFRAVMRALQSTHLADFDESFNRITVQDDGERGGQTMYFYKIVNKDEGTHQTDEVQEKMEHLAAAAAEYNKGKDDD